jgi:twinkle protein
MTTRYKDANDCLLGGVTPEAMKRALDKADFIRPEHLVCAEDIEGDIYEEFWSDDPAKMGLPFMFAENFPFRIRQRELTVWTGYSGHGKTQALLHGMVHLGAAQKDPQKVFIAPLESTASATFEILMRQLAATRKPFAKDDRQTLHEMVQWFGHRFWIYNVQGATQFDALFAAMKYVRQRFDVRQFVLDNLMMLTMGIGDADRQTKEQDRVMQTLKDFAEGYDCHVHLVAHSKKPQDKKGEGHIPRQYDILGSSNVPNLANNVIIVWRNKKKTELVEGWMQREKERGCLTMEEQGEAVEASRQKDAYLLIDKQRRTGRLSVRDLWFDPFSCQFRDRQEDAPRPYWVPRKEFPIDRDSMLKD